MAADEFPEPTFVVGFCGGLALGLAIAVLVLLLWLVRGGPFCGGSVANAGSGNQRESGRPQREQLRDVG